MFAVESLNSGPSQENWDIGSLPTQERKGLIHTSALFNYQKLAVYYLKN
jgi:hypothetical protein